MLLHRLVNDFNHIISMIIFLRLHLVWVKLSWHALRSLLALDEVIIVFISGVHVLWVRPLMPLRPKSLLRLGSLQASSCFRRRRVKPWTSLPRRTLLLRFLPDSASVELNLFLYFRIFLANLCHIIMEGRIALHYKWLSCYFARRVALMIRNSFSLASSAIKSFKESLLLFILDEPLLSKVSSLNWMGLFLIRKISWVVN